MKKFTSLLTAITVSFPLMSVSQIRQGKTNRSILNIKNRSLFKYFLLSILFVLTSGNVAWGQILTFEFSALAGGETSATSNSNNANLTSSTITRGAGLTASANGARFNATSWALTSIANAVTGNDYMEFTITPNSGYQFSVSSIVVQWQRSNTGNTSISLRSSVDSYASDIDAVKTVTDNTSTQTFTWTFTQSNSSTPVTYRLYSYAEAVTGAGGPGDGAGNDIVVNGTVSSTSASTITPASTTLTGFSYIYGNGPSTEQSFSVTGTSLSTNIAVAAPTNYEVSLTSGSGFGSSITLPQAGGTTYVRLKSGLAVGNYNSQNITLSSGTASATATCSGTVNCTTPALVFTNSTYTKNLGDANFSNGFSVKESGGAITYSSSNSSVASIDAGGIVSIGTTNGTATITASQVALGNYCATTATYTITVNCSNPTINTQPSSSTVLEGATASFSVSATGVSLTYQWQLNTGSGFSNISGATSSSYTTAATTASMSGYQYRVLVYSGTCNSTSSAATLTVRSIAVSPTSLSFTSNINEASAAQTVTVTGANLTGAPTYSVTGTDASMFVATGTLTSTGGTISVVFTPTSSGSKTATLTITGDGITKTVTLSGTGKAPAEIVISQVYGAGGNSGATYLNDYIELFNRSNYNVNLLGKYIHYASATGSFSSSTALSNVTLAPGQYYLIKEGSGGSDGAALPTPDVTGTIFMGATAGKIALTTNNTAPTSPTDANVIDFVGFGATANQYEGTAPTPAPSATTAIFRNSNGCTDTDQNSADFTAAAPAPRNTSSTSNPCSTGPTVTVSTSSITGLNYNINNGPSTAQTFTVSGSSLTNNIVITPPANFEISNDGGVTYNGIITLTQSGGTVNNTTIYVRLIEEMPLGSYSGSISLASSGATTKTVSLSGAVILGAPDATDATSISTNSFVANWVGVSSATGYKVYVYTKSGGTASFSENFSTITGGSGFTGGNDGLWKDDQTNGIYIATGSLTGKLTNWTFSTNSDNNTVYGAKECIKIGTSSKQGYAQTPALGASGNGVLTFRAGAWDGTSEQTSITLEITGGGTLSASSVNISKAAFSNYSVNITGATASTKVTFKGKNAATSRFFLDDVVFSTGSGGAKVEISGSPFIVNGGNINSLSITGLSADTQYYYTVTALYGESESAESDEIAVKTLPSTPSTPTLSVDEPYVPNMTAVVDNFDYETIHVSGINLIGNISLEISGTNSGYFTVSPLTITPTSGTVTDFEVTIQYTAPVNGMHTAILTISSNDATSIVLPLSGTSIIDNKITIGSVNENGTWNMNFQTEGNLKVYRATALNYADGVFFSKYLEAEGNTKLSEIFNGTLSDVNLSGWKIKVRQIGSSGGPHTWTDGTVYYYPLSGTLAKGTAKVFYTKDAATTCSESFDPTWTNCTTPILQFNGNDPICLVNTNITDSIIDLFGQTSGTFPTTDGDNTKGWETTGFNTMRKLLLRKTSVKSGANAVASNTTSFATLATEWDLFPMDYSVDVISCEALQEFGSFDYNANYSTWAQLTGVVGGTNNKTVDVSGVTTPSTIANCELLKVVTDNAGTITATDFIRKPIYVSSTSSVSSAVGALTDVVCEECDIAVTNNSQLNATTESKKFKNATVFTGSKLNVSSTSDIEVNDLILKAGYSGNVYNTFPTSTMKVDASGGMKINGTLKYARTIDSTQWYFISFPYDVRISDISTLNPSLGTYNTGWFIKYWDGASRAQRRVTTENWKRYIPGDAVYEANSGYLKANVGYIIGLASGTHEVQFPLVTNSTIDAESTQTIHVTAYKNSDNISNPDHDGWNLIGLPYLSKFDGEGAAIMHYLLSDGGSSKTYTFFEPNELTGANSLNPFISYYIQTGATTDISFALTSRALAPSVIKQTQSRDKVRIYYNSTTGTDYMNLVLDDAEDGNYKIGADLVKWIGTGTAKPQVYMTQNGVNVAVNALNYAIAQNIPVTVYNKTAGSVTFSVDATSATGLLSLILTDNVTGANTNLLTSNYTYTADAGIVSNRFTLSAQRIITAEKPLLESDIRITSNHGVIHINNIPANSKVEVFDTVGRMITYANANNNTVAFSSISKGVYIIQIITEGKRNSYKIIL